MKYEINEETIAIIPMGKSKTRVIEMGGECEVACPPFQIMEENCEYYGSTYSGRVKAGKKILNSSYKIPIIVEETEKMIFFPTKSYSARDCAWINYNFVNKRYKNGKKTIVSFQNGKKVELNVSKLSIDNQLLRSGMLEVTLTKRVKKGNFL